MRSSVSTPAARGSHDERGSMAVELVILAPILMMFVMLIVLFGRFVTVQGDIDGAARDAARAASLQPSRAEAVVAAKDVVDKSLDAQTTCDPPSMSPTFQAGATLVVRLRCKVSYQGLGLLGVSGHKVIEAESAVPLDPYRSYR
ncbi:TadE/TadG family type IV pilus assembly protein [Nocardioides jishulii]|uniref:Pilus assembly protein n=1 Tax=Nocardioides jishulii TaxID=2575440 RepID=A0A4V5TR54_9ACTN|nr:TadE family protein [Nocardioides jishulii]QCX28294.1 pilus assembly protein [Nocardioides jishulii]TKI64813.1 pilus assembly protein [Nocardioides jishulii]